MEAENSSNPKQVALVGPWPPYRGGIAQFGVRLAKSLLQRGHVVHPITFSRQYPDALFPGQSQIDPYDQPVDLPEGRRILDSVNPASWYRAGAYLRELRPDILLVQHWMPFFAPAYGTLTRRSVGREGVAPTRIALVHNALPHERRPGDFALSRYFLRACDAAITLSASVRHDVERIAPGLPTRQTQHPVYDHFGPAADRATSRKQLRLPAGAPILLFFGFVRAYKGLDLLLDAMPAIRERHPDAMLVVAGEFYDDEATYRKQATRLGISNAVRFEGRYLPAEEVPLYFGAADLVVQPYRTATQSGVAQAAFGFGVPVVTTDVGGLAEAVRHEESGLVVTPENPAAIAAAVNRFLGDGELADCLRTGAGSRRGAGWDHLVTIIEDIATAS